MERVWIVGEELSRRRAEFPSNRVAELLFVEDPIKLEQSLGQGERPIILAPFSSLRKIQKILPHFLALGVLPDPCGPEKLGYAVRAILQDARLQHDLDAAENIAWGDVRSGEFEEPSIEFLGASILELSAARDLASVEAALRSACSKIVPIRELKVSIYPDTASAQTMGLYQLAVPVQYQNELKAHIYVRFDGYPEQVDIDKVGEALLNLSDAVALAVERNQMIARAEETKTVWEASFDAVEDPVVILDSDFCVLRGNRAYGVFTHTPLPKLLGNESLVVTPSELKAKIAQSEKVWQLEREGKHYQVFLDQILEPLGLGRYVIRFHDITQEHSITEKILAKEQVAELGVLVGSVAHEINNPIGGILAITQILLKDLPPGTQLQSDIENISIAAERCKKIVQTMLSLVRKSDEEKTAVNVLECFRAAADLLSSEAKRNLVKIQIQNREGADRFFALANKNRILQAFFHLLQQSISAIAEKKGKQAFDAYLRVDFIAGFGNLELRIEDNGDPIRHDYEIQSSVAFTVAKMILDENDAEYSFSKVDGKNTQKIVFSAP